MLKGNSFLAQGYARVMSASESGIKNRKPEAPSLTEGPYFREARPLSQWMPIMLVAILPALFIGTWNVGVHRLVFSSANVELMTEFLTASSSLFAYAGFCKKHGVLNILTLGLRSVFPIMLTVITASFLLEWYVSRIRKTSISRWFPITALLFTMTLPPTLPLWIAALGTVVGLFLSKTIFGGDGMNIFNPAAVCRGFVVLSFPMNFSGDVWIAPDVYSVRDNVQSMNKMPPFSEPIDSISAPTCLSQLAMAREVLNMHIETLKSFFSPESYVLSPILQEKLTTWSKRYTTKNVVSALSPQELEQFITDSPTNDGLGLKKELYLPSIQMAKLALLKPPHTLFSLIIGNRSGACGEVGIIGSLIGGFILVITGVASGLIIASIFFGTLFALLLRDILVFFYTNPLSLYAKYTFPFYIHFLLGGWAFGTVFIATDPVSAPAEKFAKILYGLFIGALIIVIRCNSTAFKEGVIYSILMGNTFAPLFDRIAIAIQKKKRSWRINSCFKKT